MPSPDSTKSVSLFQKSVSRPKSRPSKIVAISTILGLTHQLRWVCAARGATSSESRGPAVPFLTSKMPMGRSAIPLAGWVGSLRRRLCRSPRSSALSASRPADGHPVVGGRGWVGCASVSRRGERRQLGGSGRSSPGTAGSPRRWPWLSSRLPSGMLGPSGGDSSWSADRRSQQLQRPAGP